MVKHFSKCMETRDELSTTCNPKGMSRYLSAPDAKSLHHCLKKKQLKYDFSGKDPSILYYAKLRMVWLIQAYYYYPHEAGNAWKSNRIAV